VEGACLTAVELSPNAFTAEVSNESLVRTTLGELSAGSRVNLERALAVGQRLGGHYVLGHVDGVGRIASVSGLGDARRVDIEFPPEMAPLFVEKGSIAIDGISLTINEVGARTFWVALIPETQIRTTLPLKAVGARVNLEGDILGKYVLRSLAVSGRVSGIDEAFLTKNGYT
jgi:riboflavin synthase